MKSSPSTLAVLAVLALSACSGAVPNPDAGTPTPDAGTPQQDAGTCGPCDTPPAAVCVDANTARTFAAGACDGSLQCVYPPTDEACPNGCQAGACQPAAAGPLQGTYPGVVPALVTTARVDQFKISPDESHLAVANDMVSSSPFTAALSLVAIAPGVDAVPVPVATHGDFFFSRFLPDGRYLFSDDVNGSEVGNLTIVNADGSGKRVLAMGIHPVYPVAGTGGRFGMQIGGGGRVFFQQGTHASFCEVDSGPVVDLDPGHDSDLGYIAPDGSAAVYGERTGSSRAYYLYTVATASRALLQSSGTLGESRWSPSGQWLFYSHGDPFQTSSAVPFVIRSDGTGLTQLAPTGLSRFLGFLPDESGVVFGIRRSTGSVVVLHRFDGSADIEVDAGSLSLSYTGSGAALSGDGTRVFVVGGSSGNGSLYSASLAANGTLTRILTGLKYNFWGGLKLSDDGTFVAASLANNQLVVLRGDGTSSAVVMGDARGTYSFARGGAGRLVAYSNVTGSGTALMGTFSILSADGTGSPFVFPEQVGPYEAWWAGRLAMEEVAGASADEGDDVWAAREDGSVSGTLARHVTGVYLGTGGHRAVLRAATNAGGGLWVVDLPPGA